MTDLELKDFIDQNLNGIVKYNNFFCRLVGAIKNNSGFAFVLQKGFENKIYIDSKILPNIITKEDPEYSTLDIELQCIGVLPVQEGIFNDLTKKNKQFYHIVSFSRLQYQALLHFNEIVQIDTDTVRLIGYAYDNYGDSYVCRNLDNSICYFDAACSIKKINLSVEMLDIVDLSIQREPNLFFRNFRSKIEGKKQ